ncbi:2-keto-4-pentenoate hydratase [Metallosphaera tengchongensis]|uniref:2-keto-4-pentenoate hydratase n=1 Tax=Metallosphaera tengchongensis TaxID=1532350 RepID=A0A6N0NTY3_9CREN|nr:2-keto-4-pentenoate hydratase [Metallosphaera tengchongensis]QKR00236.1 2-keto-4-pentenoate hydratase [Metallosphaera tengchongensis]
MDKAELLLEAYLSRREIDPFDLTEDEAKAVGEKFAQLLIEKEGLGGYKITKSGLWGVLTNKMITKHELELWFKTHKLEVEIIALVKNGEVEKTFIGLEVPATRFKTWDVPKYYMIADNAFAGRLYVGKEIEPPYGHFKLFINGELVGEGSPNYNPSKVVRPDQTGYVACGAFIGPVSVAKGDLIRVEGKKTFQVKAI